MQGFPVIVTELERGIGTAGGLAGGCRQGLGQQGHPGAVTAGVGALGIDRPGDQLHEGLKQGLLGGNQAAGFQGDGGAAGEGGAEGHPGRLGRLGEPQLQQPLEIPCPAAQGQTQAAGVADLGSARRLRNRERQRRQGGQRHTPGLPGEQEVALGPVEHAGDRGAAGDGVDEQTLQELLRVGLRPEGGGALQKTANRGAHALKGPGELIDFPHQRAHGLPGVEGKAADGSGLFRQAPQGAGQQPGEQPHHGQGGQHQQQGEQPGLPQQAVGAGEQLPLRQRHQQHAAAAQARGDRRGGTATRSGRAPGTS